MKPRDFSDRLAKQFTEVFPVKPAATVKESLIAQPKDRLQELQDQLHVRGEQS